MTEGKAIRVLIVDDSASIRTAFAAIVRNDPGLELLGTAPDPFVAAEKMRGALPDVMLLDLEMPGMGGLEALPKIMEVAPETKVLVISSLTADGAEATVKALSLGAADTMLKPRPGGFNDDYKSTLLGKIRALKGIAPDANSASPAIKGFGKPPQIVAIGASTGGIHALNLFLRQLPHDFDLPILITQHLPESFVPVFARQMELAAGREAVLAEDGTSIRRNRIVIAPGTAHMIVKRIGPASAAGSGVVTGLAHDRTANGCLPSVDPMFESVAEVYGGHAAAVLLSGMGRDGTSGAEAIARAGGSLYAQDEESCAVWGMPRAISEAGLARAVTTPMGLADAIAQSVRAPAEQN